MWYRKFAISGRGVTAVVSRISYIDSGGLSGLDLFVKSDTSSAIMTELSVRR